MRRARLAAPVLVALATVGALVAGLVGDGWWDVVAWVGLAVPLVASRGAIR